MTLCSRRGAESAEKDRLKAVGSRLKAEAARLRHAVHRLDGAFALAMLVAAVVIFGMCWFLPQWPNTLLIGPGPHPQIADGIVFEQCGHPLYEYWINKLRTMAPRTVVIDGAVSELEATAIVNACRDKGLTVYRPSLHLVTPSWKVKYSARGDKEG